MRRLTLLAAVTTAATLLFATAAPAAEPGVNIGIRPNGSNVNEHSKTAESGARWVRLFVDWSQIELADDVYAPNHLLDFDNRVAGYNARGIKVLMVVSYAPSWASGASDRITPPRNPADYAEFVNFLADRYEGKVDAFELWNEPDDNVHWKGGPQPAAYAALLRTAYPAVKQASPGAKVLIGGLVGNDYRFLDGLYSAGVKDHFDAVGVHTDTACLTSPPDEYYREPDGRIGRYSFTGYREVRQSMRANGEDKPIWMTELGWSTTTAICNVGERAGTKPGGVPEPVQADMLRKAYACLQADPYVEVALWFSLQDVDTGPAYDHRLGLLRDDGSAKPSFDAFKSIFGGGGLAAPASCGVAVDVSPPDVFVEAPTDRGAWFDALTVKAAATDDQGVLRMELYVDGEKVPGSQEGGKFALEWQGAKKLSFGPHKITLKASDAAGNVGETTVTATRVDRRTAARTARALLDFKIKRGKGRRLSLAGNVQADASALSLGAGAPKGRVRIFLERKVKGKWKATSRYTKGVAKPFKFTVKLKKPGQWRIYARYAAQAPYKPLRSKPKTFRIR